MKLSPLLVALLLGGHFLFAQSVQDAGTLHGNFQTDFQLYQEDTLIGAPTVDEKFLLNGFLNLIYTRGKFSAGARYETYQNVLLGFDERYKGSGIPYRFVRYEGDLLDVTAGSFYEQFGSGLIFRTYEERNLGFDNAMDGLRVKAHLARGILIKGVVGQQRFYFGKSDGIVRGIDAEVPLDEAFPRISARLFDQTRITVGGSFVSKYEADRDPRYNLPENVGAWAGRLNVAKGGVNFYAEYGHKINDPSTVNNYIYRDGQSLLITATYSRKGLGVLLTHKRVDNMNYRSDRTATVNDLLVNYLPAINKIHTYTLPALYPYATQPNGEVGYQAEITFNAPRNTWFGGKYGTQVALNFSLINAPAWSALNDTTALFEPGTDGYALDFWGMGDQRYYRDINVEVTKKLSKKVKMIATYINLEYNKAVIEGKDGFVRMHAPILEMQFNLKPRHTLRTELQGMFLNSKRDALGELVKEDRGDWVLALMEYTIAPHWFVAVQDAFNYGHPEANKRIHYYVVSAGYTQGTTKIQMNYGKQQQGIFCVGGVCRNVPASNGLFVTLSSSF